MAPHKMKEDKTNYSALPNKTIKRIAKAMLAGLRLAYRGKLQQKKRIALYEMIEDMALVLTREGVDEGNSIYRFHACILGTLSEEIDIPIKPKRWAKHKEPKREED